MALQVQDAKKCIPADIVDQAKQVGMDVEVLLKLCVDHTVQAARDWLNWISGKLPPGP